MSRHSLVLPIITLALAFALPTHAARADQTGCKGHNVLDELKAKDAPAYARFRQAADAEKNGKAVLWKIESEEAPDRPASYLFGTLNVTDERVLNLSAPVEEALTYSARIALEVDETSPERTQEALAVMRNALLPGTNAKLEALLGKPEATRANLMLTRSGLPKEWVPRVQPWVAMLMTTTSDCETQRLKHGKLTPDREMARQAENRGVGSFGLESTEMLLSAFATLDNDAQLSLLKAQLAGYDKLDDKTEALIQLYLTHDIGALWPLHAELAARHGATAAALAAYRENVFETRNIRMRDRTMLHLQTGGIFIAVGAMHLPGDKGLVELFKQAGYTLTAIE